MGKAKHSLSALVVSAGLLMSGAAVGADATIARADDKPQVLAPGWGGKLNYEPPKPGTYALPKILRSVGGEVLLDDGKPARLEDYVGDKNVVLSFVYTHCSDENGCPLATFVLHTIKSKLKEHPEIAPHLRLISLSFDPIQDTPEVMRRYGSHYNAGDLEWHFMTTKSQRELDPILRGFGQYVIPEIDESGEETGQFAHILKVYLIDREGWVRNIYSVSFLHAEVLIADIQTLVAEQATGRRVSNEE